MAHLNSGGGRIQYDGIQALRFVAAFAVLVLHSTFYTHERLNSEVAIYEYGAAGVRLFFVISGFVMILSSFDVDKPLLNWKSFAIRRVIRIVPIYWLATAFKILPLAFGSGMVLHAALDWGFILKSLLFIPSVGMDGTFHPFLGVGWTLNFEMFFYALFTITLAFNARPLIFISPILILLSGLSLFKTEAWPDMIRFWADPIVLDFLAGMLLAHATQRGLLLPPVVAWFILPIGAIYLLVDTPKIGQGLILSISFTLAAAAVVAATIAIDSRIGPKFPRWIIFMGAASYSLYLIHPMVSPVAPFVMAKLGLFYPAVAISLSIATAMFVAPFTYKYFEVPVTRWLTKTFRKK